LFISECDGDELGEVNGVRQHLDFVDAGLELGIIPPRLRQQTGRIIVELVCRPGQQIVGVVDDAPADPSIRSGDADLRALVAYFTARVSPRFVDSERSGPTDGPSYFDLKKSQRVSS
jgi:hypothetical protein